MESVERIYSERDCTPVLWLTIGVVALILLFLQWDIREALNIEPRFSPGTSFLLGSVFALSLNLFFTLLVKPKIYICSNSLIRFRSIQEVAWDQVTEVEKKGNSLFFRIPEARFKKRIRIFLSRVIEREDIVKDVEKMCEMKGIPFKKH